MPTLREWLQSQDPKVTQEEFASRVGLTQARISQIIKSGTNDLGTAMRIEAATKGKVTIRDLASEPAE